MQNNDNRWYDAITGRWLSQDPIGLLGGTTNLYGYCDNNPNNSSDPTGTDRWVCSDNALHWYLVVEEWDATGKKVRGYHKLDYWVWGHEMDWGGQPKTCPGKDVAVWHWKSNGAQDRALLDKWVGLCNNSNRNFPTTYYVGYYVGINCFSVSLWWCDYGGAAGPAKLVVPRHVNAPIVFPPCIF